MSGTRPHYPWSEGDELFASELNAAIANNISGPFLPLSGGSIGTFSGAPPPASSLTLSGRLYVGAATARDGSNETWVAQGNPNLRYFDVLNSFQSLPTPGEVNNNVAGMFGVRSSTVNVPSSPTFGGIGSIFYARNDAGATTPLKQVWAQYINARRDPGSGSALGIEFEVSNMGDAQEVNSYSGSGGGVTASLWLMSGGDMSPTPPNPLSVQIYMGSNGASPAGAEKGIVFGANAVRQNPAVGGGSYGKAIQMPQFDQIEWISSGAGSVNSFIRGNASASNVGIIFSNSGGFTVVDTATETPRFQIGAGSVVRFGNVGTDNTLTLTPGASLGSTTQFRVDGTGQFQFVANAFSLARTSGNNLTLTPGVGPANVITLQQSGTGGMTVPLPLMLGSTSGFQFLTGAGVPSIGGLSGGGMFFRTDGTVGARVYVYQGGSVWNAIAGV